MSWPVLLIMCVISSALASILLKIGTSTLIGSLSFSALISNYMIWLGAFFYSTAFFSYIYVLRVVPLSLAQPVITAGVSAITVFAAMILFREVMTFVNWIGFVLVCVGILFLFLGRT